MSPEPAEAGFSRYFYAGVAFRIALTLGVMALAFGGAALGEVVGGSWSPFVGAVLALAAGVLLARGVKRRWDPLSRNGPEAPRD